MRVAILVTHLLGTGHLARAAQLGDALVAAGHEALVISGGGDAPNAAPRSAKLLPLPPLRADGPEFKAILAADGGVADAAYLEARIDAVRGAIAGFVPDVLITELYPFGRRKLRAEFLAAIEAARGARSGALIYTSIRDILQLPRKEGRKAEAEARFAEFYDGALFHGDSGLIGMGVSWELESPPLNPPPAGGERVLQVPPVFETGYIGSAEVPAGAGTDGSGEIIVAAGGGAVGDAIFEACIGAAQGGARRWRILVGGGDREERIAGFGQRAQGAAVVVEGVRSDFRALLSRCEAAVLQCGYNTAMDVVATGARVVFCPFEGAGGETEQLTRAAAFAGRFGSRVVRERDLSAEAVEAALGAVLAVPKPHYGSIALDGAARSVAVLERAYADRFGA